MINTELQIVEIATTSTDFVFLLEDGTYQHLEFETSYKKDNLLRFAKYDLRLYERDRRDINTVVVYSSDVKSAAASLKIGSLEYAPKIVMMCRFDGNAIYSGLESKLKAKQNLADADLLNLIFLPLLLSDIPKLELAKKSIELAKTIENDIKRDTCIASTVAFMEKYLNNDEIKNILGVIKMTKVAEMLVEEAVEETETRKAAEMAKKALKKGLSLEDISDLTGLSIDAIKELQDQKSE